ncbi:MAG: NAD(P)/FAD-dependent oxidoreductase [Eubacteriales bacterium]
MKIGIVGGGAAGMMAAYHAASSGADVTLFEKNTILGKKLRITGKGRCNVTNCCELNEFIANIPRNGKFLYGAAGRFGPADTMAFFESLGVPLKVERGNRVFPVSDNANDIADALRRGILRQGVRILNEKVSEISVEDGRVIGLKTAVFHPFDRVIVATGGLSYPRTGSDGDGYRFAKALGIACTPLRPSLVPLEVCERWCSALQGLSLKNVALSAYDGDRLIYEDFGEMMFTHFGITGPMVLSLSSHLDVFAPGQIRVVLDLKPALDEQTLDRRILSDFSKYSNKNYSNALSDLLPSKMIPIFVSLSGISPERKVHTVTKEERATIIRLMKNLTMKLKRPRPIDEAIITSGGIDISEVSPKTMEAKKVSGLYFAGEILDADGYTGGFNLQIAFSTAVCAAKAAAT